ncbi:flagellar assembly protein FliH [Proteiniborus ethanoligenes]|uniref:Flagellar assembly protein FliH n=1 Tax=Proteiniborus ethanoligenes TaxID=415015 RepID=A0A1H3PNW9_9FIRM|nr:FliH/SctL family protein [Proteiniborus ethanoligenes]TAH63826.1 MAG: hypothetical protein EWM50_01285 [Gottschalkiaceae bacterium]SDZ02746.1 flagellar assembly protein FliH [Proteiniborus ethanoligenes]
MSNIFKSSQIRIINTPSIKHPQGDELQVNIKDKLAEAEKIADDIISKAKNEAEEIILNARRDSEKVLEETHSQAKSIYDAARDEGFNQGYEKGYIEGKEISDAMIEEANEIKKNYLKERELALSSIENDVIYMVISLCENIINQKLENDKEAILPIILKGINSLNVKENLIIKVSKEDYDIVEMSKQRLLAMANLIEDIEIRIDSTLSRGDCIIEGSKGNVDSSVNLQIEEMRKVLITLLNSE